MDEFLKETNSHEYYVNHKTWKTKNPENSLLFNKLSIDEFIPERTEGSAAASIKKSQTGRLLKRDF